MGGKNTETLRGMGGGRREKPALCIEILLFFFPHSTLELQACALWMREYFSVKRVFVIVLK